MEGKNSDKVHLMRHTSHFELGKCANVLVLYTGGTIGMHGTEKGTFAVSFLGDHCPRLCFMATNGTQLNANVLNLHKFQPIHAGKTSTPSSKGLMPRSNMAAYLKKLPMLHDHSYIPNAYQKKPDISEEENIEELVMPVSEYGVRIFYYIKEYDLKKDSSNMDMTDWIDIAMDVKNYYDKFDSFIILHGTDTMSYTASVMSYMFQNLDKSVILTGSQVPIFEQRNDGRDNLLGALMIAGHFVIPEVTLFFHDKLYRGNRTTKINSGDFQAFDSPNLHPLATLKVKIDVHWDAIFRGNSSEEFRVHTKLNSNVGVLRLFPGITDTTVETILRAPMQGIVLETFGTGNCPSSRTRFLQLLKEAVDRGVIIVNCTQCLKGAVRSDYETGEVLVDIGVISGSDMTPEAVLTKLSYVLGHDVSLEEKKKMIKTNLRGEMTVAVDESQFTLKDSEFIRAIASTLKASSVKEMHYIRKALHPLLICSATQAGELDIVEDLCKKNNVNSSLEYDDRTPLHIASTNGDLNMVKKLLEHGASLHKVDKYGSTPLLDAIRFKRKDVIRLLHQSGGHVGPITSGVAAEICAAAGSNDVALLEAWRLAGVDLSVRNATGRTPLHEAVCAFSKEAVDHLLSHGINAKITDNLGKTALENAMELEKALSSTGEQEKNGEKIILIRPIINALKIAKSLETAEG